VAEEQSKGFLPQRNVPKLAIRMEIKPKLTSDLKQCLKKREGCQDIPVITTARTAIEVRNTDMTATSPVTDKNGQKVSKKCS
jgi:uncharacterized protein YqeY